MEKAMDTEIRAIKKNNTWEQKNNNQQGHGVC